MKKYISYLLLLISFALFCFSLNFYLKMHSFNHDSVRKNIDYLSSDIFKGRLAGSLENAEVAMYVRDSFKNNNLKPYNGSYFQSFETIYPHKTSGNPYLNITDKDGFLIKEFKYGIDFKEDLLNFKKNTLSFNNHDKMNILNGHIQVKKDDDFFLFYTPENSKLNFRSSFISTSPYSMYIMITKDTFNELNTYIGRGYNINCFIPFESKRAPLNNVTAYIEGKDPKAPPLILSAHFDHIGSDLSSKVYSGALDNASGVAFLIELSKYVESIGKPDRNILFIGFNAEELGCLGSKAFVDEYKDKLNHSKIFNFDMIGGSKSVPLYIMGGKQDTKNSPLIKELSSVCTRDKINFNYLFDDASDHEHFRKQNIDAVTLCDADSSRIHTPNDKIAFIDTTSIDRCFKVVSQEIIKYGFGNSFFIVYNMEILYTSICCALLSLILLYQDRNRKDIDK